MEELFEMLLELCVNDEVVSLEVACAALGLNIDKMLAHSCTDHDAQCALKLCCNMIRGNVHTKFYKGDLAKNEADQLIAALDDIIEIYLSIPIQPVEE